MRKRSRHGRRADPKYDLLNEGEDGRIGGRRVWLREMTVTDRDICTFLRASTLGVAMLSAELEYCKVAQ